MEHDEKQGPIGPHHDEAEWLEARRTGIGASEVAAILGSHPFLTERDVYFSKVNAEEKRVTPYMERGRILEEPAAELYAKETGRRLRRMPLMRHRELPILFATLDRQILAGDDHPTAGLEIKVPAWRNYAKIRREGLPAHWILQAQAQHMVTGYPFIAFGILNADAWRMITQDFEPIPELSEKILNKVGEWWERHIIAGTPPEPKIEEAIELPAVEGAADIHLREDAAWIQAVQLFIETKAMYDEADELLKHSKDRLKNMMRDADQRCAEGAGVRAYLNQRPGRTSFDKKALEASNPVSREALIRDLQVHHHIPLSMAEKIASEAALDLSMFEKQGRPFEEFRTYILKEAP